MFKGFPKEAVRFLYGIAQNNNAEWYHEHEEEYKEYLKKPALEFVNAVGEVLSKEIKNLNYSSKSLFRVRRDTRFSKNKAPYKTHLGLLWWKGGQPAKQENPGFYFHLEAERLLLCAGAWLFTPEQLEAYRKKLLSIKGGKELQQIVSRLSKEGITFVGESPLKRVPQGFSKEHPLAEFSKYRGLYSMYEEIGLPDIMHTPDLVDYTVAFYSKNMALLEWLNTAFTRLTPTRHTKD